MKITPYHSVYNRNTGRIKEINNGAITISVNAGRNGEQITLLNQDCCIGFKPKINDRVELCIDEECEIQKFYLRKLKKTRQDKKINEQSSLTNLS